MQMLTKALLAGEEGHAITLPGVLLSGAGVIVLV